MQLGGLTIVLRPRSPWEAIDLGLALVRQQAARIWPAWIAVTLPATIVINLLAWLVGYLWLGTLLMWWLKPLFDRIPLFVLSRAVFGDAPDTRATLRAQRDWGWSGIVPWLLWRRLQPSRSTLLPVDLLENLSGPARTARSRVLLASGAPSAMLTLLFANIQIVLQISLVVLAFMFVPIEFFSEATREMWTHLLSNPPLWAQAVLIGFDWIALSLVEPFYVGAGFALYLNRRTELEAWDIELAFRRIATRLAQPLLILLTLLALSGAPGASAAAPPGGEDSGVCVIDASEVATAVDRVGGAAAQAPQVAAPDGKIDLGASASPSLEAVFAGQYRADDAAFRDAIKQAYQDPDLSPKAKVTTWQRRHPEADEKNSRLPPWLAGIGRGIATLVHGGLWILLAVLLVLVLINQRRWLPWLQRGLRFRRTVDPLQDRAIVAPADEALPDDLAAAVRQLWSLGQSRAALALLYRAALKRLEDVRGAPLARGTTEADCLRQVRRLPDSPFALLFVRIVRCWQAAAYAHRFPGDAELEVLLAAWQAMPERQP